MSNASLQLSVTNDAPNLEFQSPILWKAVKLLEDRNTGDSYAVATAIDPLRKHVLLIDGASKEPVPLRRVFLRTGNDWQMVHGKKLQFELLRLSDGK